MKKAKMVVSIVWEADFPLVGLFTWWHLEVMFFLYPLRTKLGSRLAACFSVSDLEPTALTLVIALWALPVCTVTVNAVYWCCTVPTQYVKGRKEKPRPESVNMWLLLLLPQSCHLCRSNGCLLLFQLFSLHGEPVSSSFGELSCFCSTETPSFFSGPSPLPHPRP